MNLKLSLACTLLTAILLPLDFAIANVNTPVDSSYKLTFDEEFNGNVLDSSKWSDNFYGAAGQVSPPVQQNAERAAYDPKQVTLSGGYLHLNVISSPVTVNGKTYPYRSGLIMTSGKFQQAYGYFEARVYLNGSGSTIANWPAWWLTGVGTWPTTGEIDIAEGLLGSIYSTFHYGSPSSPQQTQAPQYKGNFNGWHVYGALWEAGLITFYYDGHAIGSITKNVTSSPMQMILNYAVGDYGGPDTVPNEMRVDYVHVYSKSSNAVAVAPQAGYNGPGDDGTATAPTPTPTPVPTPVPTPKPTPTPTPTPVPVVFSVTSPANNSSVQGSFKITGQASSTWKNVAAFDLDNNYAKLSNDATPANGSYSLTVNAANLAVGSHHIAVMAFSVPAGQSGGTSSEIDLTLNVVAVNPIVNPSFESGLSGWSYYGNVAVVTSGAYSGSAAVEITSGVAGVEQVVSGLKPNTSYTLMAYVKSLNGVSNSIGVKDFGSAQVLASSTARAYTKLSVSFRTGASNTSAKIFFYISNGSGVADAFSLTAP